MEKRRVIMSRLLAVVAAFCVSSALAAHYEWIGSENGRPIALRDLGDGVRELRITGPGPASRHVQLVAKPMPVAAGDFVRVSVTARGPKVGTLRFGFDSWRSGCAPHYYRIRDVKIGPEWKDYVFFERVPSEKEYPAIAFGETRPSIGLVTGEGVETAEFRDFRIEKISNSDFSVVSPLAVPPCVPAWTGAPDRAGNLIFNSSFELGLLPAGVSYTSPFASEPLKPAITVDETDAVHGGRCVKMVVPAGVTAQLLLPMPLFTPEETPKTCYAFSVALKADRRQSVGISLQDRYIDDRLMDAVGVWRSSAFKVTTEWKRYAWERISIRSALGRCTPKINVYGPATLWVDAVQFEKTADGKATAYAPKEPVEATFALDSHLFVSKPGATTTASFKAVRYAGEAGRVDFRTTCGDFGLDLKPGVTVTRSLSVPLDEKGIRTLSGTCSVGEVYPYDFGVAPEVPPYRGGFFLGLNGCTKTSGTTKDFHVEFQTTLDESLSDNYRDLRRFGMRMIRLHDDGMNMRNYTAKPGEYDFSALDVVIDKAKAHGLEPMFVFGSHGTFVNRRWGDEALTNWYFRTHATPVAKGPMKGRRYFNPDEREWVDFIAATVRHCKGRLRWYEIVNEPNITVESAETYVRYLKLAYRAIKTEDPQAKVVGICSTGDFNSNSGSFVAKAGALGAFDHLDVLSYHPYDGPVDNPLGDGERQSLDIRAICDRYRPGLPVLQDEIYYLTYLKQGEAAHAGMKDAVQGLWWPVGHLPRRYAIDLAAGAIGSAPLSGWQHFMGDAGQRGARGNAAYFMPNDRFIASAAFAHFLEGGKPHGKPTLPPELNGFVFLDRDGQEVGMLWAREKQGRRTIAYPANVKAYDVFANPLKGKTLAITENPVYVRGNGLTSVLSVR